MIDSPKHLREALEQLERLVSSQLLLVASSWREDTAVNLGEGASSKVLELVAELGHAQTSRACLVLCGEGGRALFADTTRRALRGWGIPYDAIVLERARGALAALALSAAGIVLAPGAGIGAPDAGPVGPQSGPWTRDVASHVPAWADMSDPASARRALGVAHASRQAELCAHLTSEIARESGLDPELLLARLGAARQGLELAAGPEALVDLGLSARWAADSERDATARAFGALTDALALRKAPQPRYEELDFADTVEFAPATELPGAIVATTSRAFVLALDSGSPDPDTGLYRGEWRELDGW